MNPTCSLVTTDLLDKSVKLTTLGEGTFGSVSLYRTPRGKLVVKETKIQHKSLGYPPDFLNEVDMLVKLKSVGSVVDIEAVCFDDAERKGYLFLEPLQCNLWEWAKRTPFKKRMMYIRNLISMIGGALGIMHNFSLIHNDMKTNNILVDDGPNGPIFKLADFGKSCHVVNPDMRYHGIAKYRPPTSQDVYHSELWAFMVVLVEVILGGQRMVYGSDLSDFYDEYSSYTSYGRDRFEMREYLRDHLSSDEYRMIPDDFWKFVKPVYRGHDTDIISMLNSIGISLNKRIIGSVEECISIEVPYQPNFYVVEEKFRRRFRSLGMTSVYPKFVQLFNKFLALLNQKLTPIDLKYYAEVAFIIVAQRKVKRFEYFDDLDTFLKFQRAFLVTIGYQINIL